MQEPTQLLLDDSFIEKASACLGDAKSQILICAYAWRWYANNPEKKIQQFNYQLARKARDGVVVRVILDKPDMGDFFSQFGIKARTLPTKRAMHTKAILIDDKFLILGSHNLTERGTVDNYEASLLTTDSSPILGFQEYFNRLWHHYAV